MTSTSICAARICTWSTPYGEGEEDYYTLGYQCERTAKDGKLCTIHERNGTAFGLFEKKAPDYALCAAAMDDGTKITEGEACCWAYAKPDIDAVGDLLDDTQDPLTDAYWQCNDCDEDEDEDEDAPKTLKGKVKKAKPKKSVGSDTVANGFKGKPIDELRDLCDEQGIDHDGLSKGEMREALAFYADDAPVKATKGKKDTKTKKVKATRKPSAYNLFMKDNLPKFKKINTDMAHQDAFKAVAAMWADADENPSNQ